MSTKTLSIVIDESGDFGTYEPHAPYYLVALVYHDQSNDISQNLSSFETHLDYHGYGKHALHTGPLVRREADYANERPEVRKRLFSALFNFARKMPLYYDCIQIEKHDCPDEITLTARISRKFGEILDRSKCYFDSFDKIIIYYDNGQTQLTKIITSVFSSHFLSVEYRKVLPVDYRLFQIADMICTLELLAIKAEQRAFSKSELEFFNSIRDFKKNYLKWIRKKQLFP